MAAITTESELALKLVRSIDLPYPDRQLLECFLQNSTEPLQAARYVLQRCFVRRESPDLDSFVSDWKQLINMCTSGEVSCRTTLMTNSCLRRFKLRTSGRSRYCQHHQKRPWEVSYHRTRQLFLGPADRCSYTTEEEDPR